jgi:hypothetical protein
MRAQGRKVERARHHLRSAFPRRRSRRASKVRNRRANAAVSCLSPHLRPGVHPGEQGKGPARPRPRQPPHEPRDPVDRAARRSLFLPCRTVRHPSAPLLVVPAKAGISFSFRARQIRRARRREIPAFAGMTVGAGMTPKAGDERDLSFAPSRPSGLRVRKDWDHAKGREDAKGLEQGRPPALPGQRFRGG